MKGCIAETNLLGGNIYLEHGYRPLPWGEQAEQLVSWQMESREMEGGTVTRDQVLSMP